ncbi:hypothetical protein J6590_036576 [Homalodisca vitripennis]|nr:hypothetical protein J6590_036576 [Homalodisca vitripennis]
MEKWSGNAWNGAAFSNRDLPSGLISTHFYQTELIKLSDKETGGLHQDMTRSADDTRTRREFNKIEKKWDRPVAGTVNKVRIKQRLAWLLLGWVIVERSCPCKQSACPAIGGGSEVTFKPLVPRLRIREGFLALTSSGRVDFKEPNLTHSKHPKDGRTGLPEVVRLAFVVPLKNPYDSRTGAPEGVRLAFVVITIGDHPNSLGRTRLLISSLGRTRLLDQQPRSLAALSVATIDSLLDQYPVALACLISSPVVLLLDQ